MMVVTLEDSRPTTLFDDMSTDFFNNDIDLDEYKYFYKPIRRTELVHHVNDKVQVPFNIGSYKLYDKIDIDSYQNSYNMTMGQTAREVYIYWQRRFDKDNYIVPLAFHVNYEYLSANNFTIDLSSMIQVKNNVKALDSMLTKFSDVIIV